MTTLNSSPTIILIAGHWLGAWAWDDVLEHLESDRFRAIAMAHPNIANHSQMDRISSLCLKAGVAERIRALRRRAFCGRAQYSSERGIVQFPTLAALIRLSGLSERDLPRRFGAPAQLKPDLLHCLTEARCPIIGANNALYDLTACPPSTRCVPATQSGFPVLIARQRQ